MPPFLLTKCPHCESQYRIDFAELKQNSETILVFRGAIDQDEDYLITCRNCGQRYKITVKVLGHAKED